MASYAVCVRRTITHDARKEARSAESMGEAKQHFLRVKTLEQVAILTDDVRYPDSLSERDRKGPSVGVRGSPWAKALPPSASVNKKEWEAVPDPGQTLILSTAVLLGLCRHAGASPSWGTEHGFTIVYTRPQMGSTMKLKVVFFGNRWEYQGNVIVAEDIASRVRDAEVAPLKWTADIARLPPKYHLPASLGYDASLIAEGRPPDGL
ncbi:hypothetical protein B0I35DRAFT_496670 [Stachybotrys elegans]|uniref:Uncharacterized protein n=1 Tax=Stachybotrys elegans TaxID=80388 RepID=A0A8K0ST63_9HYPO|nr:hypothetical protein B0I35DRAFT_496670 [Stachybotrys elegans]